MIAHMILALSVLVAASILCAIDKLDSSAVIALFGAAIGLLGGNAQSIGTAVINGGPKPDYRMVAQVAPEQLAAIVAASMGKQAPTTTATTATAQPTEAPEAPPAAAAI